MSELFDGDSSLVSTMFIPNEDEFSQFRINSLLLIKQSLFDRLFQTTEFAGKAYLKIA